MLTSTSARLGRGYKVISTLADGRAKRAQLEGLWQQLKAPAAQLLRAAGVQGRASLNDFAWAYSIFW